MALKEVFFISNRLIIRNKLFSPRCNSNHFVINTESFTI
jgi:hypothetical protein